MAVKEKDDRLLARVVKTGIVVRKAPMQMMAVQMLSIARFTWVSGARCDSNRALSNDDKVAGCDSRRCLFVTIPLLFTADDVRAASASCGTLRGNTRSVQMTMECMREWPSSSAPPALLTTSDLDSPVNLQAAVLYRTQHHALLQRGHRHKSYSHPPISSSHVSELVYPRLFVLLDRLVTESLEWITKFLSTIDKSFSEDAAIRRQAELGTRNQRVNS